MKSRLNESRLNEMKVTPLSTKELKENNGGGWISKWLKYIRSNSRSSNSSSNAGNRESVTAITIPGGND